MGFGSYNLSTLQAVQGIAFHKLEKFTSKQVVETGLKVFQLLEDFKKNYPDKIPTESGRSVFDFDSRINVNDFELARHLVRTNDPEMGKIAKGAKELPVLFAYLSVLTLFEELPPEHLMESALSYAIESLSLEREVVNIWNQALQNQMTQLAPLASKGLKFNKGKKEGAIGPLTAAIRKRLKDYPRENAAAVWSALSSKPPKGLVFCDNRAGKYVEYDKRTHAGNLKNAGYARFANIVSSEVKRRKSLTD